MKKLLLSSVAVISLATIGPSHAEERPPADTAPAPAPAARWSGFYAGINVGATRGSFDPSTATGGGNFLHNPHNLAAIDAAGRQEIKPTGFTGGSQIGYNWQAGRLVLGVEADLNYVHLNGAASSGAVHYPHPQWFDGGHEINQFVVTSYAEASWLATVRPRLGLTVDGGWLLYATGGLAATRLNGDFVFTDAASHYSEPDVVAMQSARIDNVLRFGWALGGGVETSITDRLSLRAEYLHADFGRLTAIETSNNISQNFAGAPIQRFVQSARLTADMVRVGLDYKLDAGIFPSPPEARASAFADVGPTKAPLWKVAAVPASAWEFDVGSRLWFNTGTIGAPQPLLNVPGNVLTSRLVYSGLDALAGETFARVDHEGGVFAKGFLGAGRISKGQLNDEDFPGDFAYSNTVSSTAGNLAYAAVDLGYTFLKAPGARVGAFVGYAWYNQHVNGYGCTQVAGDDTCVGLAPTFNVFAEDNRIRAFRLGLSSRFMLTDTLAFTADAAFVPASQLEGQDDHNARELLIAEQAGQGDGVMLEGVLDWYVTPNWHVGAGGRYWTWNSRTGTWSFDFLGKPSANVVEPARFTTERYGVFLQTGYRWGDTTRTTGDGRPVDAPPASAPMTWTGLHVGAHLGGGHSRTDWADPFPTTGSNIAGFGDKPRGGGALGGGQIGADWQLGAFVLGIEGAISAADLRSEDTCFSGLGGVNCEAVVAGLGTVTGRVGFAWARSLVFAKGGAAWARSRYGLNADTWAVTLGLGAETVTSAGWVAGGGLEYALTDHWTTRVEYEHIGFGSDTVVFPTVTTIGAQPIAIRPSIDLVKLGVNYRFDLATRGDR